MITDGKIFIDDKSVKALFALFQPQTLEFFGLAETFDL